MTPVRSKAAAAFVAVGSLTYDDVLRIVTAARGEDELGYRPEFVRLVRAAKTASAMARLGQ